MVACLTKQLWTLLQALCPRDLDNALTLLQGVSQHQPADVGKQHDWINLPSFQASTKQPVDYTSRIISITVGEEMLAIQLGAHDFDCTCATAEAAQTAKYLLTA